jgi:carbon storage regulator CsrA
MLALSRRPGERIVFPRLDIAFKILQIKGNSVRVGIEAPPDVRVFREEIAPANDAPPPPESRRLTHCQRKQLNSALLAFHLVEKQLHAGLLDGARETLQCGLQVLESFDSSARGGEPPSRAESNARKIAALLVEDDPIEESLLTSFLRPSGFRVERARDGYEALEYRASNPRPEFVLLDMGLPRLNGQTTNSRIRQDPQLPGSRVSAVTGSSQEEAGVSTGPGGVDRWFQKPLNPARLAEAMTAAAASN